MTFKSPLKLQRKQHSKQASSHSIVPPRNPNKRPTTINMERSIGRMKSNDMDVIRRAT